MDNLRNLGSTLFGIDSDSELEEADNSIEGYQCVIFYFFMFVF